MGVDRGEWSKVFLERWQGHNFIGVDNYAPFAEQPWDREADYLFAVNQYKEYGGYAKLIRGDSRELAAILATPPRLQFFGGHPTHFIYIDGAHDYDNVKDDIAAWWPLVSDIGILAGHDYDRDHADVIRAVDEFAAANRLTVYRTTADTPPSWYIYKRGIPGPDWKRNA